MYNNPNSDLSTDICPRIATPDIKFTRMSRHRKLKGSFKMTTFDFNSEKFCKVNLKRKRGGIKSQPPYNARIQEFNQISTPSPSFNLQKDNEPIKPIQDERLPEQIFSNQSIAMDYVTLRGVETRIGVKRDDIPISILEELVDNALDRIDTISNNYQSEIYVLDVEINSNHDSLTVRISNSDIGQSFTNEIIRNTFDFRSYSSTKRNQFKIARGALGHGLKTVLAMSYALATEYYGLNSWSTLKISSGDKLWIIGIKVDKIKEEILTDFKIGALPLPADSTVKPKTTVEIDIATDSDSKGNTILKLRNMFRKYTIFNLHVSMSLTIDGQRHSYPQVQKNKSSWKNYHSIHSYSYADFENLISNIRRQDNLTLYDVVKHTGLREATNLKKQECGSITVGEAQHDKTLIRKFYVNLRKIFSAESKLELPYDMSKKAREAAIRKRLEQFGIKVSRIKYNLFNGLCKSKDELVQFPYIWEVAEIKTENHEHEIISSLNSSFAELESISNPDNFKWSTKNGNSWHAHQISNILQHDCGYTLDLDKRKKPNSIVLMNLFSPRIDYQSGGKSQIDLSPFTVLGQTVYDTCSGGMRNGSSYGDSKVTQKELLTHLLRERLKAVQEDPNLAIIDRWTPSDVWYAIRPRLLEYGIEITKNTRSNLTAQIRPICEGFGVNMEELGIFAADRAQLHFDGNWYDVGFDELDSLALKGTDLIIIEKEGIAEALAPFADEYGIALLFTRGFATKYVHDLSESSLEHGCNVVILSDYDASGILLASKIDVPRIGIDPKTLKYFELKREDVEEKYDPKKHLDKIYSLVSRQEFGYLSHKRIEINSIKTKVGNDALWKWIINELNIIFPNRNYNRSIEIPPAENVLPRELRDVYAKIEDRIESCINNESEKIAAGLNEFSGFIEDVPKKRTKIHESLKKIVAETPHYKDFISALNELLNTHPFFYSDER